MDLILREFNGKTIRQREDGYFSLTDMAAACGKKFNHWYSLSSTEDLLSVIARKAGIPVSQMLQVIIGTREGGTWGHRKVAIAFATWCSPDFFSLVIDWSDDILKKGYAISSNVTSEQLEGLKAEIARMEIENTLLTDDVRRMRELFFSTHIENALATVRYHYKLSPDLHNKIIKYLHKECRIKVYKHRDDSSDNCLDAQDFEDTYRYPYDKRMQWLPEIIYQEWLEYLVKDICGTYKVGWNEGFYREIFRFAKNFGIKPYLEVNKESFVGWSLGQKIGKYFPASELSDR